MNTETVLRWSTILFHAREGVKPIGGLELVHMGNLGITFSLRGKGFYENIANDEGWKDFRTAGVDTLLCGVSESHYRLMRAQIRKAANIHLCGTIRINGKRFVLVLIRDPKATNPNPFKDFNADQIPNA